METNDSGAPLSGRRCQPIDGGQDYEALCLDAPPPLSPSNSVPPPPLFFLHLLLSSSPSYFLLHLSFSSSFLLLVILPLLLLLLLPHLFLFFLLPLPLLSLLLLLVLILLLFSWKLFRERCFGQPGPRAPTQVSRLQKVGNKRRLERLLTRHSDPVADKKKKGKDSIFRRRCMHNLGREARKTLEPQIIKKKKVVTRGATLICMSKAKEGFLLR